MYCLVIIAILLYKTKCHAYIWIALNHLLLYFNILYIGMAIAKKFLSIIKVKKMLN